MTKRLAIRAGEAPVLYGKDNRTSMWQLWHRMSTGEDTGGGDFAKWTARLGGAISDGIIKDHGLLEDHSVHPPHDERILAPRVRRIKPTIDAFGRPGVLVVGQRSESALFGWNEPSTIPERDAIRLTAIAAAYDVDIVYQGFLVDGYTSRIFSHTTTLAERATLLEKVDAMIAAVRDGDEPEIDFSVDRNAVRKGLVTARAEASSEAIDEIAKAYLDANREVRRLRNEMSPHEARRNELLTTLIHLIGDRDVIETDAFVLTRAWKADRKTVEITAKKMKSLF